LNHFYIGSCSHLLCQYMYHYVVAISLFGWNTTLDMIVYGTC
jgi:hypothetical protein